mmetsp:Transcript_62797/g.162262  ORF Transcript_62797/g.162262 Transcript_62797/m.162262 type:complete len:479 (-) Transcript_62797:63-1499(-)
MQSRCPTKAAELAWFGILPVVMRVDADDGPGPRASSSSSSSSVPAASLLAEELGPLSGLLLRGEGFNICAGLEPADLARLACVNGSVAHRDDLWRAYFVLRWGSEQGASQSTEVRVMRSWFEEAWPKPWPLAAGFCGARSSLDHLFWVLPIIRILLRIDKPTDAPPPPLPPSLMWQVVCRVRTQPHGAERMARCFLCDVMEVAPPGPAPQHFRQRWTRPCASCPRLAHRACLEHQMLGAPGDARAIVQAGIGQAVGRITAEALKCPDCCKEYQMTRRFAESLPELLFATMLEWRWVLRRVLVMLAFHFWLHSLAVHYSMLDGLGSEVSILILFTATLMSISVSQRFHRSVQMIWHTQNRWHYFKVFGIFAVIAYLAVLRVFQPARWKEAVLAAQLPWLTALHEAQTVFYSSDIGIVALSTISWLYVLTASGLCFCFWKTSLRVPTVADVGQKHGSTLPRGNSRCGLCQLGLCLDNTGM